MARAVALVLGQPTTQAHGALRTRGQSLNAGSFIGAALLCLSNGLLNPGLAWV